MELIIFHYSIKNHSFQNYFQINNQKLGLHITTKISFHIKTNLNLKYLIIIIYIRPLFKHLKLKFEYFKKIFLCFSFPSQGSIFQPTIV